MSVTVQNGIVLFMAVSSAVAQVRHLSPVPSRTAMDPRIARTRATVLRTATDLLVEGGPAAVTVDAVVARSGVARSTIYRHWDTRDDLLIAVIEQCAPALTEPDAELGFEAALRRLVDEVCVMLSDPDWARVLPALLALRNQDHGIAALEQRIEEQQEDVLGSVLRRGIDEGRLPADLDLDRASALLVGPLMFETLMARLPVDPAFGRQIVDAFLRFHPEPTPRSEPAGRARTGGAKGQTSAARSGSAPKR